MVQSRRKVKKFLSITGVEVTEIYCRKCRQTKKPSDFFTAVDEVLDTNGYMSICKDCCDEIYNNIYNSERNLARSILQACRIINLRFDENAVESTRTHLKTLEEKGTKTNNTFGIYKAKVLQNSRGKISNKEAVVDLKFQEVGGIKIEPENPLDDKEKSTEELKQFWGDRFEREEYEYLESEYSNWKSTNPPVTRNDETILKLVVLKLLSIRKAINASQDTSKLEEGLTKLMTAGALNPQQANAAGRGKIKDCFGVWIDDIEKVKPAEWWKDHSIYKDVDDIQEYFKVHLVRPFLNFWGVQRDFNFEGSVDNDISIEESPDNLVEN